MINSFAIVITTHKRVLNDFELKNLKIISYHHPSIEKFIVLPQTLDTFFYRKNLKNYKIIRFNNFFFRSWNNNQKLYLSEILYQKFNKYQYILLTQPDGVLVKNIFHLNINSYDYLGSPSKYALPKFSSFYNYNLEEKENILPKKSITKDFFKKTFFFSTIKKILLKINNFKKKNNAIGICGGISLRRVRKFIKICKEIPYRNSINAPEDHIFSYFVNIKKLKSPSFSQLEKIFAERNATHDVYGYHKLYYYNPTHQEKIFQKYKKIFLRKIL